MEDEKGKRSFTTSAKGLSFVGYKHTNKLFVCFSSQSYMTQNCKTWSLLISIFMIECFLLLLNFVPGNYGSDDQWLNHLHQLKVTIHRPPSSPLDKSAVIPVHYHLLDVVSYLPYNDVTFSQSTQISISSDIKMRTHLTENTKCFPKIIVCFFVNPPHVGLVKSRHDHVIKMWLVLLDPVI